MSEQHGSYYVPDHSALPIIGAIGLFLIALGSLNFSSTWGIVTCCIGLVILAGMLFSWFREVIRESRAGLYSRQMDHTFRWGLFWFIFAELFFFGILLGALVYIRVSALPWLAGHGPGGSLITHYVLWPNFEYAWPLLKNPAPYLFAGLKQTPFAWGIPTINTLILLASAVVAILALLASKRGNRWAPSAGLLVTIILGIVFLFLQIHYCIQVITHYGLTINSGIYGSLFYMLTGFHTLHVIAGLLLLSVILVRSAAGHFVSVNTHFAFEAAIWFWALITFVWLLMFVFLYGF